MNKDKLIAELLVKPDDGTLKVLGLDGYIHPTQLVEFLEESEDSEMYLSDVRKAIEERYGDDNRFYYIVSCELEYVELEQFGTGLSEFNPPYYHIGNITDIKQEEM